VRTAQWPEIHKESLLQRLVVELRVQIVSGKLVPGDRLPPVPELAEQFGVSAPLLREVLAELRARGFVRTVPRRGTFVTHPGQEELADAFALQLQLPTSDRFTPDELYEARAAIELFAVELAAQRAGEEQLAALEQQLTSMYDTCQDPPAFTAADVGFHVALARASGNKVLPTLLLPIISTILEGVYESSRAEGAPEHGIAEHEQILAALRRRDPVAAVAAMAEHIRASRTRVPESIVGGPRAAGAARARGNNRRPRLASRL
jgi:GntR family transcriptional repressor for pyruvate dehydrogenase complex